MPGYIISRIADPLFAALIGATAAWKRIRREELSRYSLQHSDSLLIDSLPSLSPASAAPTSGAKSSSSDGPDAPGQTRPQPPTPRETLDDAMRRLRKVQFDPRKWEWEWRDLWRKRERWGIVDPNG